MVYWPANAETTPEETPMSANATLEIAGRFERGHVVLDRQPVLPEGARLQVRIDVRQPKPLRKFPPEFFELAGSIPDLERPPQGEYEVREPLACVFPSSR